MKLRLLGHLHSAGQQTARKQEWYKNSTMYDTFYSAGVDKKLVSHATIYILRGQN